MKNYTIEIKWALRFTLLTLAWAIGEKLIGLHDIHIENYALYTNLFVLPALLFYILALKEKKKYFFDGEITWTQGFVSGIILSFIIAILSPFSQFVIYKSITPNFFANIIEYKTKNKMYPITLKAAHEYFNMKSYIIQSCFSALSTGITTGAIISLFIRSKK